MKKNVIYCISLVLAIVINIIFMMNGIFGISRNLYYIPILLGMFYYESKGIYLSLFTSFSYIMSVFIFNGNRLDLINAIVVSIIFICISYLVYTLIKKYKDDAIDLDAFFDINADMMSSTNHEGYFLNVNKEFKKALGYEKEELVNKKFIDFVHPDDVDRTIEATNVLSKNIAVRDFVNRYRCKDGGYRYIEWYSTPKGDTIYSSARDITQNRELVNNLEQNAIRMKITEELVSIGNTEINLSTGKLICSDGMYKVYKLPLFDTKLTFDFILSSIYEEDRENVEKLIKQSISEKKDYAIEHRIIRNDGDLRWVSLNGTFIKENDADIIKHIFAVRDITDYMQIDIIQSKNSERYKRVYRISKLSNISEEELFNIILSNATALSESNDGYIFLYDNNKKEINIAACLNEEIHVKFQNKFLMSDDNSRLLHASIMGMKEAIIINNPKKSLIQLFDDVNLPSVKRLLVIPIFIGDDIIGSAMLINKSANYDENDRVQLMSFMDGCWEIIKRKRTEKALQEQENWLKTTLLSIGDGVIATDVNGIIKMVNLESSRITNFTSVEVVGKHIKDVYKVYSNENDEQLHLLISNISRKFNNYIEINNIYFVTNNHVRKELEVKVNSIKNFKNNVLGFVFTFRDVTKRIQYEREIFSLTYNDKLTGLFNRRYIEEYTEKIDNEEHLPISIIVGDVNGLKLVNDAFGHLEGDKLLILAGKIIKDVIRKEDVAARWGGDEYIILLPNTTNEEAQQLVNDITKKCNEEPNVPINLSISMGFATKTKSSENMKEIFKQADDMMYKNKSYSSISTRRNTVNAILSSLHSKFADEEVHSVRVSKFCIQIGKAMKLREDEIIDIEILGKIHDIGKISIGESILNKPSCLSADEYEIVRRHPEIGYNIICSLPELSYLANNVLAHHEKWDGTGYPNGLKERNIPLMARILCVADAFEAMTSDKPYRKALSIDEAVEELKNCSGTQFDPQVVDSFLKIL